MSDVRFLFLNETQNIECATKRIRCNTITTSSNRNHVLIKQHGELHVLMIIYNGIKYEKPELQWADRVKRIGAI